LILGGKYLSYLNNGGRDGKGMISTAEGNAKVKELRYFFERSNQ
jgi:hypothetical protein